MDPGEGPRVLSSEDATMARAGSPAAPTLADEARTFWSHRNPPLIAALLMVGATYRLTLGEWRWWDLGVVVIAVALQPFVEWTIHVFVLHAKPLRLVGRTYDSTAARKHREHHTDPRKIAWIFLPLPALAQLLAVVVVVSFLVTSTTPLAATAFTWTMAMLLIYEVGPLPDPLSLPAKVSRLPLCVARSPAPPLPQRALLVRDHVPHGRPGAAYGPGQR